MQSDNSAQERATLENWRERPNSTWGFQNVRSLIPTDRIWRGLGQSRPLEPQPTDLLSVECEDASGRVVTLEQVLAESDTNGFALLHRGKLLVEIYANGLRPETPHIVMSISKSMTATLAAILIERGVLGGLTLVTDVIPELGTSAYAKSTVRDLLDMTVAIDFEEDNDDPDSDIGRFDIATGWSRPSSGPALTTQECLASLRASDGQHGETVTYASPNTDVLGWMIERLTGRFLSSLLSEELWQPMGAEFDAAITVDRIGTAAANGGISATLRDLARFGQLCVDRGAVGGSRIVPEAWFDDIAHGADKEAWKRSDLAEMVPAIGCYRSNWWVADNSHGAYCGVGIHGQSLYVDPTADMVIAKLSSQPLAIDLKLMDIAFRMFHALAVSLVSTAPA
jgi:hypothetical protein